MSATLNDWQKIFTTISRYSPLVDSGQHEKLHQVFTDDCRIEFFSAGNMPAQVCHSPQELGEYISRQQQGKKMSHLLGMPVIDISSAGDNTATALTYVVATVSTHPQGTPENVWYIYGQYEDKLVKIGEDWKIKERQFKLNGPGFAGNLKKMVEKPVL